VNVVYGICSRQVEESLRRHGEDSPCHC
jgi:hypothetical protein